MADETGLKVVSSGAVYWNEDLDSTGLVAGVREQAVKSSPGLP